MTVKSSNNKMSVIVLLSGGIDSAACVYYYLRNNYTVKGLFIDYGQSVLKREYDCAKKISKHYRIKLDTLRIDTSKRYGQGEIRGRNAMFVIGALMKYNKHVGLISLGIHSGTQYYDASEQFFNAMNSLLASYTNGIIRLDAPFLRWDKTMIYEYCKSYDVPVRLTYSCEQGLEAPCGRCKSCLDRKALNAYAGEK